MTTVVGRQFITLSVNSTMGVMQRVGWACLWQLRLIISTHRPQHCDVSYLQLSQLNVLMALVVVISRSSTSCIIISTQQFFSEHQTLCLLNA